MRPFAYHRAVSVDDALARHEPELAEFVAGGTTLLDLVKLDVMRPQRVVDINRLPLATIEPLDNGGLRVGALVRNSDLAWDERVRSGWSVLSQALLAGASGQLRNMATTGGNLMQRTRCPYFRDNVSACNKRAPATGCAALEGYNRGHAILGTSDACIAVHPSDMCVALAALDAIVHVRGPNGDRDIPLVDFHREPGATPHIETELAGDELITAVTLPPPLTGTRSYYLKVRDRESYEFALVSVAAIVAVRDGRIRDARLALGGVGTKPWRAWAAEARLRGAPVSSETFAAAAAEALRGAAPRRDNAFKVSLARNAILRALEEVTSPPSDASKV